MRRTDRRSINYRLIRHHDESSLTDRRMVLPGHIVIPEEPLVLGAVVSSTVVVTAFDPVAQCGGICHFVRPRPMPHEKTTAIFGQAAALALLRAFTARGSRLAGLKIGLYGGACPPWGTSSQRELVRLNIQVVVRMLQCKGLRIADKDVGGTRGRKIMYNTGTNEMAVFKTDHIRRTDWFPVLLGGEKT